MFRALLGLPMPLRASENLRPHATPSRHEVAQVGWAKGCFRSVIATGDLREASNDTDSPGVADSTPDLRDQGRSREDARVGTTPLGTLCVYSSES